MPFRSEETIAYMRAAVVGGKAQMQSKRRQDAAVFENFVLDGEAIDNFLRDQFDHQAIARWCRGVTARR